MRGGWRGLGFGEVGPFRSVAVGTSRELQFACLSDAVNS